MTSPTFRAAFGRRFRPPAADLSLDAGRAVPRLVGLRWVCFASS
jgi:hypothetical protein